jgi:hypothetical protein
VSDAAIQGVLIMTESDLHPVDAWVGPGLFKLGYMTNDLNRAVDHWRRRVGVEEFVESEATFGVVMADGRTGSVTARIAFSFGRQVLYELVQPVDGLVEFFVAPLQGAREFTAVFHHMGVLVDDIEAAKRVAAASGNVPILQSPPGELVPMAFYEPPLLGYYVEHVQDRTGGIKELQNRPLPSAS